MRFAVNNVCLPVDDLWWLTTASALRQTAAVRWADLFGDLEGQLDATALRELEDEVADRSRRELARIRLVDRLAVALGGQLVVTAAGAGAVSGRLTSVGADFLLLDETGRRDALLPFASVVSLTGLPRLAADPDRKPTVQARLGLGHALRAVARDRSPVVIGLTDGGVITGTVERVAADHLDLVEHAPDESPRPGAAVVTRVVAFTGIGVVRAG